MATVTDMTQVQGWFKTSYADSIEDLTPDNTYYAKSAKALSAELQPGGGYSVPVNLTSEQGITKASSNAGAFALNPPVAMASRLTTIVGSQMLLRSALDYETIFRSKNKNAFVAATKGVVENMIKSMYFYQECDMMWGQTGVGIANGAYAALVLTLTTATWAPGLWLGSEGRKIRIESALGVLRGTATITAYDIEARTITTDVAPAGVIATDVLFWDADGAAGVNCMLGLFSIISTTTGTLFGISRVTYGLWRSAGTYTAGNAPLTFNKIMGAIARASNRGLGDDVREIDVVVHPFAYRDLGNDLAAMRHLDASYKPSESMNGQEDIVFYCPAGKVSIVAHKMMKEGYAFVHPKASRCLELVGASPKPTFELPGMVQDGQKQYLKAMENNAGVETRLYSNSALFTTKVSQMIVIDHIVNAV
jgi:hypothetical protein